MTEKGAAVVLVGSTAKAALTGLSPDTRVDIVDELRHHLDSDRLPRTKIEFGGKTYTASVLPSGHTAVYRRMTRDELGRQGRRTAPKGFVVIDILPPERSLASG